MWTSCGGKVGQKLLWNQRGTKNINRGGKRTAEGSGVEWGGQCASGQRVMRGRGGMREMTIADARKKRD